MQVTAARRQFGLLRFHGAASSVTPKWSEYEATAAQGPNVSSHGRSHGG